MHFLLGCENTRIQTCDAHMKALTLPPSIYYSEQILQPSRVCLNHQRPAQKKGSGERKPDESSCFSHRFCSGVDISILTRWKSSSLIQNKEETLEICCCRSKGFRAGATCWVCRPFHDSIMNLSFSQRNKRVSLFYQTRDLKCVNRNFFLMIRTAVTHSAGTRANR